MSVWRSSRKKAAPAKNEDVVDLSSKFGMSFDSDSDSSDAEFAPENEAIDSDDSHEFIGDDNEASNQSTDRSGDGEEAVGNVPAVSESDQPAQEEGMETEQGGTAVSEDSNNKTEEEGAKELEGDSQEMEVDGVNGAEVEGGEKAKDEEEEEEYNPLIVRRSRRAIKPTKDIDLYLLGAKFGIDVEGSDADSSDQEFSPTVESDPESVSISSEDDVGARALNEVKGDNEGTSKSDDNRDVDEDEEGTIQSVSEFSSVVQATQPSVKNLEVALCCVCLEDSSDGGDIVECDRCGIAVHEGCYGVPEEDSIDEDRSDLSSFTTVPWFCDACKAGIDPSTCACELCPNIGGLFKQTINGRWVHMVCSLYTPGIEYVEPSVLGGITLDHLPSLKWGAKPCLLCDLERYSKTGVCIGCDAGLCKSVFHVTCAQKHGLLCEVESDDEDKELCEPFFAHCKSHSVKEITKRKRRNYLTMMTKQKTFNFDDSDERIQHYLEQARKEYVTFFKKMQDYYQPEMRSKREDRLLHTVPNALRRLTEKARLLGYEVEVGLVGTDARRKIAPSLTVEFVNYFSERLARTKSIQEQISVLESTNKQLKEEEGKLKEQLSQVERELSMLRSEVGKSESQASNIYLNLSKLYSEWELGLPDSLKDEQQNQEKEQLLKDVPVCDVCKRSRDSHMMALCDTCNKHYHIGCLDPPLSKVPKKSSKWGWQCEKCCVSSGDELTPTIADFDVPASRCGRKIQPPKALIYQEEQVKKKTKRKYTKAKK